MVTVNVSKPERTGTHASVSQGDDLAGLTRRALKSQSCVELPVRTFIGSDFDSSACNSRRQLIRLHGATMEQIREGE